MVSGDVAMRNSVNTTGSDNGSVYEMARLASAISPTQAIALSQLKESQLTLGEHTQNKRQPNNVFAKLVSMRSDVDNIELVKLEWTCGRDPTLDLDYTFKRLDSNDHLYRILSRKQFQIVHNFDTGVTYITDLSRNGTLVNKQRIGKDRTIVLSNRDSISIGYAKYDIFIFEQLNTPTYPKELTDKLIMTSVALGKGGYGRVIMAAMKSNFDKKVAVKILSHQTLTSSIRFSQTIVKPEDIENEVCIMRNINHPNCMRLYEVVQSIDRAFIVMELVSGGELFDRLTNAEHHGIGMGDDLTRFYAWQLLNALSYLHRNNITHRDIKPENILCVDRNVYTVIKLVDFGLAKSVEGDGRMRTKCGTPAYTAPEMLTSSKEMKMPYTEKVDVWSLGVVLFMIAVGYPPFSPDYGDGEMDEQIKTGKYIHFKFDLEILQANRRPTSLKLLTSPWMSGEPIEKAKKMVQTYENNNHFVY
ncbi:hypothetical protein WR25_20917 [Diploscapter pachys]|uniref:Uncharacterized protein n=1 Tax=Diploscapter pachys TaxID=2018661 RepID=A0A2A2JDD0_9BILA|nr:hypothetical protein WR25_20917 [Diploscapter pachys]